MSKPAQNEGDTSSETVILEETEGPDVDIIDGITIMSFDSFEKCRIMASDELFLKPLRPNEIRKSITGHDGGRISCDSKQAGKPRVPDLFNNPAMLLVEESRQKASSTSSSINSAFVSDLLDSYLAQSDLKDFRKESFGAPPDDSRIYTPGILRMDGAKKRPMSVEKTDSESKEAAVRIKRKYVKRNLNSQFDSIEDGILTTYFKTQHPKKISLKKKIGLKEVNLNHTFETIEANHEDLNVEAIKAEASYVELTRESLTMLELRRVSYHVSIPMDESYVRYALEPLRANLDSPSKHSKTESPTSKSSSEEESCFSMSPVRKGKGDADIATMISRHSKRDIRLPARYHNSGLMLGNQWVTPGVEPEKRGRKRLVDEQRRLNVLRRPLPRDLRSPTRTNEALLPPKLTPALKKSKSMKSLRLNMPKGSSLLDSRRSEGVKKKTPVKAVAPMVDASTGISPKKVEKSESTSSSFSSTPSDISFLSQDNVMKAKKKTPKARLDGPKVIMPKSKLISEEMKELYRNLMYECKSGSREFYQLKGIKPRVHKQQVVIRATQFIEELEKNEKQLIYIKQLVGAWNGKLSLCHKVMTKEVVPDAQESNGKDAETVVRDVLKAYQQSQCYTKIMKERKIGKKGEFTALKGRENITLFPNSRSYKKPNLDS